MANTVLIDMNHMVHVNHNTPRLTANNMEVQAIFQTCKSLRALANTYYGWNFIALWDGKAQWRFDLLPATADHEGYKGNRKPKTEKDVARGEARKAQLPYIRTMLTLLGITQIKAETHEADDLAGILTRKLNATGDMVVLVTGDKDWIQLVNDKTIWIDPVWDRNVTMASLHAETGYFTTEEYLQGKALVGDTSDNVPGIKLLGEKGAPEFMAEFRTVERFWEQVDSGTFVPRLKKHVNLAAPEGRETFRRNMKLMDLRNPPLPEPGEMIINRAPFNGPLLRKLFERLNFSTLLRDFDNFTSPFAGGSHEKAA